MLEEPKRALGILKWSFTKIDQVVPGDHVHSVKLVQHKIRGGIGVSCYRSVLNIFLLLSYRYVPT